MENDWETEEVGNH